MIEVTQMERVLSPGNLRVLFQPIFHVLQNDVRIYEVEGLIRGPRGTHIESPDVLFEYVRRKGKESKLDRACVTVILESARQLPASVRIGINVTASTLGSDQEFPAFVRSEAERLQIATSRITIEIVEHAPFWDGGTFLGALDSLRNFGIRIALDDIGMGQSNYRMILDCHPDYFKLDRYIVHGCSTDPQRRAVLASTLRLAQSFSARVIAEGVEELADFQTLETIGVDYVQGYLLARPMTVEALIESGLLNTAITQRLRFKENIFEPVSHASMSLKLPAASNSISVF